MDASGDRPFCAQMSLSRPHQAFTPDRQYWEVYPDDLAPTTTLSSDEWDRPNYRTATDGKLANGHDPAALAERPEVGMKNYL
jgi:hypothetical protein